MSGGKWRSFGIGIESVVDKCYIKNVNMSIVKLVAIVNLVDLYMKEGNSDMANSKIIIVEGAQGAGKTTITDYLRNVVKHTNLYRLSGVSDSTITGLEKSSKMYYNLLDYIKTMENLNINLLFDRTFFSEENYCRLGKKDYSFTEVYNDLLDKFSKLDFDIYYFTLYLQDESLFEERLKRDGKVEPAYAKFSGENSIKQQREYLNMAEEIRNKYSNINVYNIENSKDLVATQKELNEILGI